jgi:Mlc titration factor MtfA (ptsG expression regulator)
VFGILKRRRRERLRAQPFPPAWRECLERWFPLFAKLPKADQDELQGHIQVFLAEKNFEGCGGLKITEEMKVIIAAQACLLLLHRETDYYSRLHSILVYPSTYVAKELDYSGHVVIAQDSDRLGESWHTGAVVLAWDSARTGAMGTNDGQNVVFHEFAHQLDQEDGHADGAPILAQRTRYAQWARVLGREFKQLCDDAASDRKTLLDHYGAKNPAEFFAVATECFFEKPQKLRHKHPELYEELKEFYRQDPCEFGSHAKPACP